MNSQRPQGHLQPVHFTSPKEGHDKAQIVHVHFEDSLAAVVDVASVQNLIFLDFASNALDGWLNNRSQVRHKPQALLFLVHQ